MPERGKINPQLRRKLGKLVENATVDAYNDDEQRVGFLTAMEDELPFPFPAKVVGEDVVVEGVGEQIDQIVARCRRKGRKYRIEITSLGIRPGVNGSKWVEAYKYWLLGESGYKRTLRR